METHPESVPEPVLLIIADISGYTRYMTANARSLAHSQKIITELVKTIVQQIESPLEVAKLEGDAVFLFCRKLHPTRWAENKRLVGDKVMTLFRVFREKVLELSHSTTCTCNACRHIEELRLKIVVHSGEALFHRVLNFVELGGVDVIIVHRLLKNSVAADQYLLLTEAARQEVELADTIRLTAGQETYEDIGTINTLLFLPGADPALVAPSAASSFGKRFCRAWTLFCQLWFAPFVTRSNQFSHVVSSGTAFGRIAFVSLTALLMPVFLPVGTMLVLLKALKSPAVIRHRGAAHEHKTDGSSCRRQ